MLETIKKTIKPGERYIIVEEDQPKYIIMAFEDYEKILASKAESETKEEIIQANQDIDEWRSQKAEEPEIEEIINQPADELKIEDMPF